MCCDSHGSPFRTIYCFNGRGRFSIGVGQSIGLIYVPADPARLLRPTAPRSCFSDGSFVPPNDSVIVFSFQPHCYKGYYTRLGAIYQEKIKKNKTNINFFVVIKLSIERPHILSGNDFVHALDFLAKRFTFGGAGRQICECDRGNSLWGDPKILHECGYRKRNLERLHSRC